MKYFKAKKILNLEKVPAKNVTLKIMHFFSCKVCTKSLPFKNLFSYKYLHLLSRYFLSSTSKLATKCLLESRLFKGSEDTFFIEFSSWIIICFNWNWQPSNFWARGNRKNWHCSKTWSKWNFTNFSQSTFWNYLIIWRYFTLKKNWIY